MAWKYVKVQQILFRNYVHEAGGSYTEECYEDSKTISNQGGTPLVVAKTIKFWA